MTKESVDSLALGIAIVAYAIMITIIFGGLGFAVVYAAIQARKEK